MERLTDIDLSDLQIGERLTLYRGSGSFIRGPLAAGLVGLATVIEVQRRSAILRMPTENIARQGQAFTREYRLRFKDGRICRVPNGEVTKMYVHSREGKPTVTVYLTGNEYALIKGLLAEEAKTPASPRTHRLALRSLDRIYFHEELIYDAG